MKLLQMIDKPIDADFDSEGKIFQKIDYFNLLKYFCLLDLPNEFFTTW